MASARVARVPRRAPFVDAEVDEGPERDPRAGGVVMWRRLLRRKRAVVGVAVIAMVCLMALAAPLLAPYEPDEAHLTATLLPPAWVEGGRTEFLLGTDTLGRDVLSRIVFGARISIAVGLVPVGFCLLIGGTIGLVAGYVGGVVDALLMRLVDVFSSLPDLLLIIVLAAMLRETAIAELLSGMVLLVGALALTSWTSTARLVRGQVLAVREQPFVEAARALGASPIRVVARHVLPHVTSAVLVQVTIAIPSAIMAEAVLSFLGIGVRPPTASWGNMVQEGYGTLLSQPSVALAPALCITLATLGFTLVGDALREALDPRTISR